MKWNNNIEVFNEDCMETMSRYEDNYFDLAVVDPPYGIGINTNIGRRKGDKKSKYHEFAGKDSSIPDEKYFKELFRVSKNQIIWGGNYMTDFLKPSPCWLLWDKGFSENVTFAQYEMAWTSFTSSAKKYDFNAAANRNRIHPTEKPSKLYEWTYKKYAKKGDKILDTHFGSGSNAIGLNTINKIEKMELSLVAAELDKKYYDKSKKRFDNKTKWISIFD
tara:strand:- start:47 stop:703 length:657 start_codon:yes stop_codon:yes gene_type:complete